MIKPEELRIGNIILELAWDENSNGDIVADPERNAFVKVDARLINIISNKTSITQYEPIPLTEELLVKAGFEKDEGYNFGIGLDKVPYFTLDYFTIILSDGAFYYSVKRYDGGTSENFEAEVELKYLYKLQNLFYEIKGTELTIKL